MKKSFMLLAISTTLMFPGCGINDGPSRIESSSKDFFNSEPVVGSGIIISNVAQSTLTVNWGQAADDTTTSASLNYKLVYSVTESAIDSVSEVDALSGAPVLMNWVANTLTSNVTGLTPSTQYYFAVIVRDSAGKKSLYSPVSQTTSIDNIAPVVGSGVVFSNIADNSMTVSWGQATDDNASAAQLQYKLVYSTTSTDIDTVGEVDALTGGPVLLDWTANTTTANTSGLTHSTQYHFAVLVRDSGGNKALYTPVSQTTTADTGPVVGTGIVFSNVSYTSLTASWGQATDDNTSAAQLQYKLVYSTTSTAIDTVAEVDALSGGSVLMDWTANTTSVDATGLTSETQYYFAVLVRDSIGSKALYSPAGQATPNPIPVIGTAITYTNVDYNTLTVNWGAASDDATPTPQLQYKLVYASSSSAIDTIAEADALNGSSVVLDWTANTTAANVTGLSATTQYYFTVLVRDAANNKALYAPVGQLTPTPPAQSNLLSHWKFDNDLLDEEAQIAFTGVNSPTFSASRVKFGTHSVQFNGTSQYLTTNYDFSGMTNFTMAGWIYVASIHSPAVIGDRIGFWGQNDLIEMGLSYKNGFSGFRLCLWVAGSTDVCDTVNFSTGQWVHVAITGSTTAGTAIFKNGQRVVTGINMSAGGSAFKLQVGYGIWGSQEFYLNGNVDELAMWNRVLSNAEISDLANQ